MPLAARRPLSRDWSRPPRPERRAWALGLAVLGLACAAQLGVPGGAAAAVTCPDIEAATPYETPVTITLSCESTEPVTYGLLGSPPTTLPGNTVTYTPPPGLSGRMLAYTYTGYNGTGSDHGNIWVTVGARPAPPPSLAQPNRPPVARCDSYSVAPGEMLSVRTPGVLRNDTDPDGDRLRVTSPYGSDDNFPVPAVYYNGSFRWTAPTKQSMFSYRYIATDGMLGTESTFTIWVGQKNKGCRAAFDPPPIQAVKHTQTLLRTSGSVRVRTSGRWRALDGRRRLTRPILVDARRGSVRVRLVNADNYTRTVTTGRLGGGVFKLGRRTRLPNGKLTTPAFTRVDLVGALGCRSGRGPGRRLEVAATPVFTINALRVRVNTLALLNRQVLSRFTVSDRCNGTSVVSTRAGRVMVNDHNTRDTHLLKGRRTYVAR
jgi:hypothetical protein